jgi:hypothetical protein
MSSLYHRHPGGASYGAANGTLPGLNGSNQRGNCAYPLPIRFPVQQLTSRSHQTLLTALSAKAASAFDFGKHGSV